MRNLLVEDTISKFPYQLLAPLFGDYLTGSSGNRNLQTSAGSIKEETVILVDVSPDNISTVLSYTNAIEATKSMQSVYVIPYPCIEYCFIRSLLGYVDEDMKTVLTFGNYTLHTKNVCKKQLNTKNYEKFCKSVVHLYKKCMRNDIFVTSDCLCSKPLDSNCLHCKLETKQYRLCYGLPVFLLAEDTDDLFKRRVSVAIKEGESRYYEMAKRFLEYGIIEVIQPLPHNPGLL